MIHIQGMGIPGCLLANLLTDRGIDFTWSDRDTDHVAWKASTGAIYPSGSTKFGPDEPCRDVWAYWHDSGFLGDAVEKAQWIFNHKSCEPHGGKHGRDKLGDTGLSLGRAPSYHFNAQMYVEFVRRRLRHQRVDEYPAGAERIITHGFQEDRLGYAYWGWTRLVELAWPSSMLDNKDDRPCFYFRDGRVVMAYAYPVPGTQWWYAGSSLIKQKVGKFKSLDMPSKYERWKANFERLSGGHVRVIAEGDYLEGWRPAAKDDDWVRRYPDGSISLRPLWNSGIRHFPYQWQRLCEELRLPQEPMEVVSWTPE